ncbi:MAG: hypothetical protein LBH04_06190 [Tannerellaceae bacterium]|jgi:hypothetical protein|nr:hypothetical protein [Tannerellaceae bacterium]
MKKIIIIISVLAFFTGNMFSQNVLKEFEVIREDRKDGAIYAQCMPEDGVLVFNTTISDLDFVIINAPNRLKNKKRNLTQ